jgi:hypothetical protein
MNCCFCSTELDSPDEGIELGWISGFWHDTTEYAGPICPDCRAKRLVNDKDGNYLLKPGCSLPPAAVPLPQFPSHQPPYKHGNQKFRLGRVAATPAALRAIDDAGQTPDFFLDRHAQGDWGEMDAGDRRANDEALVSGDRIVSAYRTLKNARIWLITEADRSTTTIILPSEY